MCKKREWSFGDGCDRLIPFLGLFICSSAVFFYRPPNRLHLLDGHFTPKHSCNVARIMTSYLSSPRVLRLMWFQIWWLESFLTYWHQDLGKLDHNFTKPKLRPFLANLFQIYANPFKVRLTVWLLQFFDQHHIWHPAPIPDLPCGFAPTSRLAAMISLLAT